MNKAGILFTLLLCSVASLAQAARPTVYIEPQSGFETYLAAAISKKNAPVDVVTDRTKATYILKAAPVEIKSESTGGKIARCLFAYCAGIEDKGNVSVQLIESGTSKMAWAYSVNKQRGSSKNSQSMAEAVAKHLKDFVSALRALFKLLSRLQPWHPPRLLLHLLRWHTSSQVAPTLTMRLRRVPSRFASKRVWGTLHVARNRGRPAWN